MADKTIGAQLDDLGLSQTQTEGQRVLGATVTLLTERDGHQECHQPITLPPTDPSSTPVPHPVERRVVTVVAAGQQVSEEQRARIAAWLKANGVDPSRVTGGPITIECTMRGDRPGRQVIAFTEYYENPNGQREMNWKTLDGALTYQRWVEQVTPIDPDPSWNGWDAYWAQTAAHSTARDSKAVPE